jgi:lauroyl/myristoyl acyltransferase
VGNGHKIVIKPMDLIDTGDKENDIYNNTLMYTKAVEDAIRKYQAQWVWMHKRWKTKPDK